MATYTFLLFFLIAQFISNTVTAPNYESYESSIEDRSPLDDQRVIRQLRPSIWVDGESFVTNYAPFIAAIYDLDTRRCTGVIGNEEWILTTTRCCKSVNVNRCRVRVGSTTFPDSEVHKAGLYVSFNENQDLCAIKISGPLKWGPNLRVALLPNSSLPNLAMSTIYGWGTKLETNELTAISVRNIERGMCQEHYPETLDYYKMCVGNELYHKGVCGVEYGAPLVVHGVLYGLASENLDCNDTTFDNPLLFTDTYKFKHAILKIIHHQ